MDEKRFKNIEAVEMLYTNFVQAKGMKTIGLTEIPAAILKIVKETDWSRLKWVGKEPEGQSIHGWEVESITLVWFDGRTARALNLLKSGQVICDNGDVLDGAGSAYQAIIDQLIDEKLIDDEITDIPFAPIPRVEK